MHLGTTIAGVLLVIACVLPLVIASRNRKKRQKALIDSLTLFAKSHNAKISEYETWSGTAIGIDKDLMRLFFIRNNGGNRFEVEVTLAEIQQAGIVRTGRTIKGNDGDTLFIERLEMELFFNDKDKPKVLLEFYDNNRDNINLSGELQLLEKWVLSVNELMEDLRKSKRNF